VSAAQPVNTADGALAPLSGAPPKRTPGIANSDNGERRCRSEWGFTTSGVCFTTPAPTAGVSGRDH
jgi:hypothetical protein